MTVLEVTSSHFIFGLLYASPLTFPVSLKLVKDCSISHVPFITYRIEIKVEVPKGLLSGGVG